MSTPIDCPRCRKQVTPTETLGNLYCSQCGRWLSSKLTAEEILADLVAYDQELKI